MLNLSFCKILPTAIRDLRYSEYKISEGYFITTLFALFSPCLFSITPLATHSNAITLPVRNSSLYAKNPLKT